MPSNTFFAEAGAQHVPRVVFADLEPSVVDEVRTGPVRGMFNPDAMLLARKVLPPTMLVVTKLLERSSLI